MAAAIDQQPRLPRRGDGRADVHARHRTAGGPARAILPGDDDGRPVMALPEPARDDADHTGVPVLVMGEDEGGLRCIAVGCVRHLLERGLQHRRLDLLALAVQRVEAARDLPCAVLVLRGQQARAETRLAHPSPCIDPGPEDEAQVVDPRRLLQPGDVAERPQPDIAALPHHREPLAHQRAVDAGERHHVADRAERHQVEPLLEVGLGAVAIPARLAQAPVEPDDEEEGHPHRRELAVRALLVQPVGVDHGAGLRQPGLGDMVVDHDHVEAGVGGVRQRIEGGDAAIDGDDHPHTLRGEQAHGGAVGSVALAQAVGDVERHGRACGREEAAEEGGRCRAVHVVVAEDCDLLAGRERPGEAVHGLLHVAQVQGLGQQAAERGLEIGRGVLGPDAARREHAPHDLRRLDGLGEGESGHRIGETRAPAPAEQRPLHAEHRRPVAHRLALRRGGGEQAPVFVSLRAAIGIMAAERAGNGRSGIVSCAADARSCAMVP